MVKKLQKLVFELLIMSASSPIYISSDPSLSDMSEDECSTSEWYPLDHDDSSVDVLMQEKCANSLLGCEISRKIVNVVYADISHRITRYKHRSFHIASQSWGSPQEGLPHSMKDFPFASVLPVEDSVLSRIIFAKYKFIMWAAKYKRIICNEDRRVRSPIIYGPMMKKKYYLRRMNNMGQINELNNVYINGDFEGITQFQVQSALYDEQNRIIYIAQIYENGIIFRYLQEISHLSNDENMDDKWKKLAILQGNLSDVEIVDIIDDQYLCFFATICQSKIMGFALNLANKTEWTSYSFTMLNAASQIGLVFVVPSMVTGYCRTSVVAGYCRTNCVRKDIARKSRAKSIPIDILRIIYRFYVGQKALHMVTRNFEHFHCCYSDFSRLVRDLFTKKRTSIGTGIHVNRIYHDSIRFTYLRYVSGTLR